MKVIRRERLPGIACPVCNTKAMVRTSLQITETMREIRLVCTDDDCDCSFVAQVMVSHIVRPSKKQNPRVLLPIGNQNLRKLPTDGAANPPPQPDLFH